MPPRASSPRLLEKDLGQPVNVVNRTGGSRRGRPRRDRDGAAPDGYTIGMITVEIAHDALAGPDRAQPDELHAARPDERGSRPASRCAPTRPTRPLKDLVDGDQGATRASSRPRAPARAASGTWRWPACCSDLRSIRPPCRGCRRNGAAPGLQDLVAGGVEIVPCSLPEARAMIDAGKVREPRDHGRAARRRCIPNVPTLKEATRQQLDHRRAGAASAAPKGMPAEARDKLGRGAEEGLRQQGVQGLHGGPRLRRGLGATGRVREVHGQVATPTWARR